ncbi:MAG TPA: acetylxylan esterase [Verrucomicrobiae bacterium]|nr:acetylxylan esterase [Verrucomicrobiae bacterium]
MKKSHLGRFRLLALAAAAGWPLLPAGALSDTNGIQLSVVTDHPGAVYAVGEDAKFLVTLGRDGQPITDAEVSYTLGQEGMPEPQQGKVRISRGAGAFGGTLKEPGFLQCKVFYRTAPGATNAVVAMAGAGFDPLKIKPSMPVPEDFDAFWARQKQRLATVPMRPELTPIKSPVEGVECFDAQIPCVPPRPVSGYFARPSGAKKKGHPAMLFVHGAGVRGSILVGPAGAAKQFGALAMDINAHGIPNGKPKEFYDALNAGELKDYRGQGREDRERCYFLGMFLRLVRAMEFLKAQPEWDGKVLIVRGGSQGGGQSIAAAGLDPQVSFISAGVPAICDHSGRVAGRVAGWPKLVPEIDGKPDPKVLEVARYFDCMNFATRAKAEGIFDVGFIDVTCPPSSVYAMYNNWPGKKEILIEPLMGHSTSPRFVEATNKAIAEHIAKMTGR